MIISFKALEHYFINKKKGSRNFFESNKFVMNQRNFLLDVMIQNTYINFRYA